MKGKGVTDRSAACFSACMALVRAGFSEPEILTILTDRENFLGNTPFEHRSTKSRAAAAAWVRDYCLAKAYEETSAEKAFSSAVDVTPILESKEEIKRQTEELTAHKGGWQRKLQRSGKEGDGPPKPTYGNCLLIVRNMAGEGIFRRDLFASKDIYAGKAPWDNQVKKDDVLTDDDAQSIKEWLTEKFHVEPPLNTVYEVMTTISLNNKFHPVKELFSKLPPWDGEIRLDGWLQKYFGATEDDPEYVAQVFRKWMVAAVTRIFQPGAKFDWMIVFQGNQGIGKSAFGKILFDEKYVSDWIPSLETKDAGLALRGKMCLELSELEKLGKAELETVKWFITNQVQTVRPPYGRKEIEIRRQCVLYGTTNKEYYLKDDTGNRRFSPVKVGTLNVEALERDREQLWAEALFIYENGLEKSLYFTGRAAEYAKFAQSDRMILTESMLMQEAIYDFYQSEILKPETERFNFDRFKIVALFNDGFGPLAKWREDARTIQTAADALKALGGSRIISKGTHWWRIGNSIKPPRSVLQRKSGKKKKPGRKKHPFKLLKFPGVE